MNIALCWFGEYRNADVAMKFNHFTEFRKKNNVIDFISTWKHRISNLSPEYNIVSESYFKDKITKNHISPFLDVSNLIIHESSETKDSTTDSMIFHFRDLINRVNKYFLKFDIVIFLRMDTIYHVDFDFLSSLNFQNKVLVQTVGLDSNNNLNYIHDILFISSPQTITNFIDNLKYNVVGSNHKRWAQIIEKLNIECKSISSFINKKKYSVIVRYMMRDYLKSIDEMTDSIAIKQRKISGKVYHSQKII